MTEEEAIDILRNAAWLGTESELAELEEAVNMACKALEFVTINNNPDDTKVTKCNDKPHKTDLISRQDAIDTALEFFIEFLGGALHEDVQKKLIAKYQVLPSAQPEYDISDIDDMWEYYAEEHDLNLTDNAKQIKEAMWIGYQKGKKDAQPEIIHCKYCKWWGKVNTYKDGSTLISCKKGRSIHENGYCYLAERRTE